METNNYLPQLCLSPTPTPNIGMQANIMIPIKFQVYFVDNYGSIWDYEVKFQYGIDDSEQCKMTEKENDTVVDSLNQNRSTQ